MMLYSESVTNRELLMIFVLILSALAGAMVTFSALWSLGLLIALLGAALGGSLLAFLVALAFAARVSFPGKLGSRRA
jgi:uncharacterized integral membrane protein